MTLWSLTLLACGAPETVPQPTSVEANREAPTTAAVDFDDPTTCAPCHGQVVTEWERSMHRRAHHDEDPVYGAMRSLRMDKQGEAMGAKCNQCHTPRSPDDPTTPAALAGVSCATCHATERIDRAAGMGARALVMSDTVLHGPHDLAEGASPVHGTGASPSHFADGQSLCLACHDATKTPSGAAACTTGPEHLEVDDAGTCVSCHMPRTQGSSGAVSTRADHASHEFLGPHHAWNHDDPSFLATAVDLSVQLADGKASVSLANRAAHGFPTGFPGRLAVVTLTGTDAAGTEVWTGPETVLRKVYVDAAGKPTSAAFATELKSDQRLKPGETRAWTVEVPAEVTRVEATVMFRLMPPPLALTLGLADAVEAQPRVVTTASSP